MTTLYSHDLSDGDEVTTGAPRSDSGKGRIMIPIYVGRPGNPRSYELHREISLIATPAEQQAAVDEIAAEIERQIIEGDE